MSGIEHVNSPHLRIADNNFDLIRLGAALQVALLHVTHSLSVEYSTAGWARLLEVFPGVPIFFFISGLLISRSYERSRSLKDYALIARCASSQGCTSACSSTSSLWLRPGTSVPSGRGSPTLRRCTSPRPPSCSSTTRLHARFGDGVLNGSLWTICVELQFYVLIP